MGSRIYAKCHEQSARSSAGSMLMGTTHQRTLVCFSSLGSCGRASSTRPEEGNLIQHASAKAKTKAAQHTAGCVAQGTYRWWLVLEVLFQPRGVCPSMNCSCGEMLGSLFITNCSREVNIQQVAVQERVIVVPLESPFPVVPFPYVIRTDHQSQCWGRDSSTKPKCKRMHGWRYSTNRRTLSNSHSPAKHPQQ